MTQAAIGRPTPLPGEPEQFRVLLRGISWETYTSLVNDIGDGAERLTYDNGILEIELPGRLHEQIKKLTGTIAEIAMNHLNISFEPAGSTTWRKEAELKGLEADDSYHIQTVRQVLGKSELDLNIDPPPDLAIEIEVASPLMDKMEVYRGLKVRELWRIRADAACSMFHLDSEGAYQPIEQSVAIPILTSAVISHYVLLREQLSYNETLQRFESEFLIKAG